MNGLRTIFYIISSELFQKSTLVIKSWKIPQKEAFKEGDPRKCHYKHISPLINTQIIISFTIHYGSKFVGVTYLPQKQGHFWCLTLPWLRYQFSRSPLVDLVLSDFVSLIKMLLQLKGFFFINSIWSDFFTHSQKKMSTKGSLSNDCLYISKTFQKNLASKANLWINKTLSLFWN